MGMFDNLGELSQPGLSPLQAMLMGGTQGVLPYAGPSDRPISPWAAIGAFAGGMGGGIRQQRIDAIQQMNAAGQAGLAQQEITSKDIANQLARISLNWYQDPGNQLGGQTKQDAFNSAVNGTAPAGPGLPAAVGALPGGGGSLFRPQPGQAVNLPGMSPVSPAPADTSAVPPAPSAPDVPQVGQGLTLDDTVKRMHGYESAGDWRKAPVYDAQNPNSSAGGAGQFIDKTWVSTFKKLYPDMAKTMSDDEILAQKTEPGFAVPMTKALAQDNIGALQKQGLPTGPGEIYLAHFVGAGGAARVLQADSNTPIKELLTPGAIKANTVIDKKTGRAIIDGNTTAGDFRRIVAGRIGVAPTTDPAAGTAPLASARAPLPGLPPGQGSATLSGLLGIPTNQPIGVPQLQQPGAPTPDGSGKSSAQQEYEDTLTRMGLLTPSSARAPGVGVVPPGIRSPLLGGQAAQDGPPSMLLPRQMGGAMPNAAPGSLDPGVLQRALALKGVAMPAPGAGGPAPAPGPAPGPAAPLPVAGGPQAAPQGAPAAGPMPGPVGPVAAPTGQPASVQAVSMPQTGGAQGGQGTPQPLVQLQQLAQFYTKALRNPAMAGEAMKQLTEIQKLAPPGYRIDQNGNFYLDPAYAQGQATIKGGETTAEETARFPFTVQKDQIEQLTKAIYEHQKNISLRPGQISNSPDLVASPFLRGGMGGQTVMPGRNLSNNNQELLKNADHLAEETANSRTAATTAALSNQSIDVQLSKLPDLDTTIFPDEINAVKHFLSGIPGMPDIKSASANEVFEKIGTQAAVALDRLLGQGAGIGTLHVVQKGIPNRTMTKTGMAEIFHETQGINDYTVAAAKDRADYLTNPARGNGSTQGWQEEWLGKHSPWEFVLGRLSPESQGEALRNMSTPDITKVLTARGMSPAQIKQFTSLRGQ
jgi:hypothetical protein